MRSASVSDTIQQGSGTLILPTAVSFCLSGESTSIAFPGRRLFGAKTLPSLLTCTNARVAKPRCNVHAIALRLFNSVVLLEALREPFWHPKNHRTLAPKNPKPSCKAEGSLRNLKLPNQESKASRNMRFALRVGQHP